MVGLQVGVFTPWTEDGRCSALPMKIEGGSAGPVRMVDHLDE